MLRCLNFKPDKLRLVRALTNTEMKKRMEFCESIQEIMEDETFISCLIFNDEVTLQLIGTVNRHNVLIWENDHPHEIIEH